MNTFLIWSIFAVVLMNWNPSTFVKGTCGSGPDEDCVDGAVAPCCTDCEGEDDCEDVEGPNCYYQGGFCRYRLSTTPVLTTSDPTEDPTSDPTTDPTWDPTWDPTFDPTTTTYTSTSISSTSISTTSISTSSYESSESTNVCDTCETYSVELVEISHNVTITECPDEDYEDKKRRHRARRLSTSRRILGGSSGDGSDSTTKCIRKPPTTNGGWNNRRRRLRGGMGMRGGDGSDGRDPCNDDDGDDDDDDEYIVVTEICLRYSLEYDGNCPDPESIFLPLCNTSGISSAYKLEKLISGVKPSDYVTVEVAEDDNTGDFGIEVVVNFTAGSVNQFQICLKNVIVKLTTNITEVLNNLDTADTVLFEGVECDENNDGLPCLNFYVGGDSNDGGSGGHHGALSNGDDAIDDNEHGLLIVEDMSPLKWIIAFASVLFVFCFCIFGYFFWRICTKSSGNDEDITNESKMNGSMQLGEKNMNADDDDDFDVYGNDGLHYGNQAIVIEHEISVDHDDQY